MKQTVDVLVKFDESTEGKNTCNLTCYACAYRELLCGKIPRLRLKLLVTQGYAVLFTVKSKYYKFVCLADFENVCGIVDMEPCKVACVSKAIEAANVDKCAERSKTKNLTFNDFVNFDVVPEFIFLSLLFGKKD